MCNFKSHKILIKAKSFTLHGIHNHKLSYTLFKDFHYKDLQGNKINDHEIISLFQTKRVNLLITKQFNSLFKWHLLNYLVILLRVICILDSNKISSIS